MLIQIRKSRWAKVVVIIMTAFMFMPLQYPISAYALSGGPTPPEYATFQKVGSGSMVDPFSGNVQYSLSLFEIGGYPISLTYSGDINPEQNAGWVGLGWSLQAGSIGRAMRGIPDDFKGDEVKKEINKKPRIIQSYDFQFHNKEGKQVELVGLNGGIRMNGLPTIVHDNYRGFGINYDVNMKFGVFNRIDSILSDTSTRWVPPLLPGNVTEIIKFDTTNKKDLPIMDFNTSYSSYDGNSYSVIPKVGFIDNGLNKLLNSKDKKVNILLGNPAFRFNTHTGLQSMGMTGKGFEYGKKNTFTVSNYGANFLTQSHVPSFNPDMHLSVWNTALSLEGDRIFSDKRAIAVKVTVSTEKITENTVNKKGYGCLYMNQGENTDDALLDHQQASMLIDKYTQSLPPTVSTYDVFNISASGLGGSFKVKYNSLGLISPPSQKISTLANPKIFIEIGAGTNWKIAGDLGLRHILKKTGRWDKNNDAADYLAFKKGEVNNDFEPFSFRNNFEFIETETDYHTSMGGQTATKFGLKRSYNGKLSAWKATSDLYGINNNKIQTISSELYNANRSPRQQSITYLTAEQAKEHGIQKKIQNYHFIPNGVNCESIFTVTTINSGGTDHHLSYEEIDRDYSYRKGHHLSEINVLQPNGMRFNFGLPLYQVEENKVSFSVKGDLSGKGLDDFLTSSTTYFNSGANPDDGIKNDKGIDNHYEQVTIPAYANAFLLTTILSTDYSDLGNDGPTTDDLGSYVKFNYAMPDYETHKDNPADPEYDPNHHLFNWRAPFENADWSRGYKSDELDDQGSFSYGKREQWYMHSIETKDEIAVFELADRVDGYGVTGRDGGVDGGGNRQKYLVGIKIYDRRAFERDGLSASPIKQIIMHYSHDLCNGITSYIDPGVPSFCNDHPLKELGGVYTSATKYSGGKLTLQKIEFIEGSLGMLTKDPYIFEYKTANPDYEYKSVDRWGTFHRKNTHQQVGVANDKQTTLSDHPYTYQNKDSLDKWASAWMLSDIRTPSGGKISLEYESDDYAYVQNKQAMTMTRIKGIRQELSIDDENLAQFKKSISNSQHVLFHGWVAQDRALQTFLLEGYLIMYRRMTSSFLVSMLTLPVEANRRPMNRCRAFLPSKNQGK